MPITEVDHQKIKNRICQIIQSDTNIYDQNNPEGKLRHVQVGMPPGKFPQNLQDLNHPALVITNNIRWIETRKKRGESNTGALSSLDHIVRYDLYVIHQDSDSVAVEKTLDLLWKGLYERLEQFANLRKPSDDTDALVQESFPVRTELFTEFRGSDIDGFRVTLECLIVSS